MAQIGSRRLLPRLPREGLLDFLLQIDARRHGTGLFRQVGWKAHQLLPPDYLGMNAWDTRSRVLTQLAANSK